METQVAPGKEKLGTTKLKNKKKQRKQTNKNEKGVCLWSFRGDILFSAQVSGEGAQIGNGVNSMAVVDQRYVPRVSVTPSKRGRDPNTYPKWNPNGILVLQMGLETWTKTCLWSPGGLNF